MTVPMPAGHPLILRTLKRYHAPAAFFMVGLQMEKNLPLVKKVYDDGFTIGKPHLHSPQHDR
jgi:peptidoglycan/xylan/chitin deacetylase (PgdA/CDA1 family)